MYDSLFFSPFVVVMACVVDSVVKEIRSSAEIRQWAEKTNSAVAGAWVTLEDESKVMNGGFVETDLFVQFTGGGWFASKCIFAIPSFVFFVGSDGVGFGQKRTDFREAVENNRMKFLDYDS